jgi:two-component system sensor histidine kinase RegB
MIDEMLSQPKADHSRDLDLVNQQIEQCRITLKQLQSTADQATSKDFPVQSLLSYFDLILERWQLMRPKLEARISYIGNELSMPKLKFHPTIAQSILNLLNNAADASPDFVAVEISWSESDLVMKIRDKGAGFNPETFDNFARPFTSDKSDGLGLGLFLSHSTITRFGGTVSLQQINQGGTLTTITLPFDLSDYSGVFE